VDGPAIDEYTRTALDRNPRVRPAAGGVNAVVSHAEDRAPVRLHIGRTRYGRPDTSVRTVGLAVRIRGHQRLVTDSGKGVHGHIVTEFRY